MDTRLKLFISLCCSLLVTMLSVQAPVFAKSSTPSVDSDGRQRYIVILDDPPLASYDGRILPTPERFGESTRLAATANSFTGASKLDVNTIESKQYLHFLDERFESFRGEALLRLGRQLEPTHRYRNALNGFATEMTAAEARALRAMPRVQSVELDQILRLQTDSGPAWIGADIIHNGQAGVPASGGEGVVIGLFDTGINWDHPSFQDFGEGGGQGWDHVNPYGSQLGLCSDPEVSCNDKLVGVYDHVVDLSTTPEPEEYTKGKDNQGHGSHVASILAGNPTGVTLNGIPTQIGGVAPNANIISYRVCFMGDPDDTKDDGCQSSAIQSAIDQAITDGVDIVNHSIGGPAADPWNVRWGMIGFLNLRDAGIFVATSNGNDGPKEGTTGSPGNAPWITSAGYATHDRFFGSVVENLSGGDTTPPSILMGQSGNDGVGIRNIVHARDYGNALCGVGQPELGAECDDNTGITSNPFAPGTFNGEIVVCDRGDYGRKEKGKNILAAGAGGYILANSNFEGSSQDVYADDLCLPSIHVDISQGDKLRAWLSSGSNHRGSISGDSNIYYIPEAGDIIAANSARGPNLPPTEGIMKPDVIAPGVGILGAMNESHESDYEFLNGSSMASPHVAGGAALIKSVHPDWTPTMLASAIAMTATPERAIDYDDSIATVHKRGAGRPRLDQAVNAGLFLDETKNDFLAANPQLGGDPRELNLPGLIDQSCEGNCSFQRTVTDLAGGAQWTASAAGFADNVSVSISPDNFNLANAASRELTITVDLAGSGILSKWVYGEVRLSSAGLPDAVFPVAVFADGGLPDEWVINSDDNSGWQMFPLEPHYDMPDATFTSGGLVVPTETTGELPEDPTPEEVYDTAIGLMTKMVTVPADTLWLHAETLVSTSEDLDLFVGRDTNGDGRAQEDEELCASTSEIDIESCDLYSPVAGNYWILVQNWTGTFSRDDVTLVSAVVSKDSTSRLTASGSGIVEGGDPQEIRLSWNDVGAVNGTNLLGVVGVGTGRDEPNNLGYIPVRFNKTGVANPETVVLMNGVSRGLTIGAGVRHDRMFVDIPSGTDSFTIAETAGGDSSGLTMELYRMDFDDAFTDAPFASAVNTSGPPLASATGTTTTGPSITVSGNDATPGRWYVVLENSGVLNVETLVTADMSFSGTPVPLRAGLWQASSRENLSQGFDYSQSGDYRAFLWYTYDEEGNPAWYVASGLEPAGNAWVAELLRVTNDGSMQQESPVGHVSVTLLAEEDSIFSFVLFGKSGSDRERPSLPPGCPEVNGTETSFNGAWSRAAVGVGGATVVVNAASQAFVHYIFDDQGRPVWLIGTPEPQSPDERESTLLQFEGDCAVCSENPVTAESVGLFTRDFSTDSEMSWNLNYVLNPPLSGSVDRTDTTYKFTSTVACE